MNLQQAMTQFEGDVPLLAEKGVHFRDGRTYIPESFGNNIALAMDAQPQLQTTVSGGIPAFLTTMIDPQTIRILFAPLKAAEMLGEQKKGTWTDTTAFFPVIESAGEVTSYGDFNANGHVTANFAFPQRQNYNFQTIKEYGEIEVERAGRAAINFVSEIDNSAATVIQRFLNQSYFYGISGIQNYGLLNDPNLPASLTPSVKAYGGTKWVVNGVVMATANEIYADVVAVITQIVTQNQGNVSQDQAITIVTSPGIATAFATANSFGKTPKELLSINFPNVKFETAPQYAAAGPLNPGGMLGGEFLQAFVKSIDGQDTGYGAFTEKMRTHALVTDLSSWKQKISAGTWGMIIRMPQAFSSMVGL